MNNPFNLMPSSKFPKNWVLISLACGMLLIQFWMHRIAERSFNSDINKTTFTLNIKPANSSF